MNKDTLVIDVETKKIFAEVGGEKNIRELGISVAGVYSYRAGDFFALEEHELSRLEEMLESAEHVIGFNINHFDIPVMEPYMKNFTFQKVSVTDLYVDAVNFLGHRVGLAGLAQATLGTSKSGHGLDAIEWFRQGEVEKVKKYCLNDVRITRDLYEYGKKQGHVLFESYVDHKIHSIPVPWGEPVAKPVFGIMEEAFHNRRRLSIEYISSENTDGLGYKKSRLIDIYSIKKEFIEAYCHLRGGLRVFRISRIVRAEPTGESYAIPNDSQGSLF